MDGDDRVEEGGGKTEDLRQRIFVWKEDEGREIIGITRVILDRPIRGQDPTID